MSKFVVEIKTDNDAFEGEGGDARRHEVARILEDLSAVLRNDDIWDAAPLFDINGNRVGFYAWQGDV